MLPLWARPKTLGLDTDMVVSARGAKSTFLPSLEFIARLFPCGLVNDGARWLAIGLARGRSSGGFRSVQSLLGNKLAFNAPFALSGKLHSSKEVIILHNPWQRVALCQFGDLGTVHNVVEHLFSS